MTFEQLYRLYSYHSKSHVFIDRDREVALVLVKSVVEMIICDVAPPYIVQLGKSRPKPLL
jgi:hypothetical protein